MFSSSLEFSHKTGDSHLPTIVILFEEDITVSGVRYHTDST